MQLDRATVVEWASGYSDDDAILDELRDQPQLTLDELVAVVDWKMQNSPGRRNRIRDWLRTQYTSDDVGTVTRAAFHVPDDRLALQLLCTLDGIGAAIASAVLTAHDPQRYTVIDRLALSCLRDVLGVWPDAPREGTVGAWRPYLRLCRRLAAEAGVSLRTLDRALFIRGG